LAQGDSFNIVHRDEVERTGDWHLVRRTLGLASFGLTLVTIPPGGGLKEHDETARDQEEVFFVLEGEASAVIDGQEHSAPAGTFVRLDPELRRNIVNNGSSEATVLIVSAPRSSGYVPMSWA
jgi:uncharacterized cupin superfamily protein